MITESMLILPALYIIDRDGPITMTELKIRLTDFFNPTGEDAVILAGRKDTRFSQIVRNLRSHRATNGMKHYTCFTEGKYTLTDAGKCFLRDSKDIIDYLFSNKFPSNDIVDAITQTKQFGGRNNIIFYREDEMIEEGRSIPNVTEKRIRSQRLREVAIQHFSEQNGIIRCAVCHFSFEECYGPSGRGFIEIHHERPVCQYPHKGFEELLAEAILFVKPVCSNCHRMLHRSKEHPVTISELQSVIRDSHPGVSPDET